MTKRDDAEAVVKEIPGHKSAGQRIMVRVDETRMITNYANSFRTFQTPDELMLDFGINMIAALPQDAKDVDGAMLLTINNRIIINYQNAKRLAMSLGNLIRAYEQKYGEIKLQVTEP